MDLQNHTLTQMNNEEFPDIDYDLVFSVADDEDLPSGSSAIGESFDFVLQNSVSQGLSSPKKVKKINTEESELEEIIEPHIPIREIFPAAEEDYLGGKSDGNIYSTVFISKKGESTYDMIRAFLNDEGYRDIPLPLDFDELLKFRIPSRNKQILLFEDNGYTHNPVKILFPKTGKSTKMLILELYNEDSLGHLLRFHRKS
jgi:hypothetical protein